jgi:hypothetical protein
MHFTNLQAQTIVKVSQGKDVFVRQLTDTNVVFGPVVNVIKAGESCYAVEVSSGKWNMLDPKLLPVFVKPVDAISAVSKGVFMAKQKGKWGIANLQGKWVQKPEFDDVFDFQEGLAFVLKKDLWGIVNHEGEWILRPSLKMAKGTKKAGFHNETAIISLEDGFHVYNTKGDRLNNTPFKRLQPTAFKQFWAISDAGYTLHNAKLQVVADEQFEWVETEVNAHPVRVKNKLLYGFYDVSAKRLIVPCEYEMATAYKDGYAVLRDEKGFTFVDSLGNVFSSHWAFLKNIGKGLFAFSNQQSGERNYGLMDALGKIIIPAGFTEINEFRGEWAPVLKNGRYYMFDQFGAPLFEQGYERLFQYNADYILVGQGNKMLVLNKKGSTVLTSSSGNLELF